MYLNKKSGAKYFLISVVLYENSDMKNVYLCVCVYIYI